MEFPAACSADMEWNWCIFRWLLQNNQRMQFRASLFTLTEGLDKHFISLELNLSCDEHGHNKFVIFNTKATLKWLNYMLIAKNS